MPVSFYIKSDLDFLSARLWIPARNRRQAVIFCHGWGGSPQYDDLLESLADNGFYALRFHQRGYGSSTGKSDLSVWAKDMAQCASTLEEMVDKVWAAGQSTGGTISLVAAAEHSCFEGAISIAPFCDLQRIMEDNVNARSILESRFGDLQERHHRAANALEISGSLRKPVLIVHGTEDQTVPFNHGQLLYERLGPSAQLMRVEKGNHHLRNVERRIIFEKVVNWLKHHGGIAETINSQ